MTPHANGCDGPVTDYVVTVVSSPDVYFNPPAQTICSQQTSSLQVLSHVPGTTFAWTTSASSPNLRVIPQGRKYNSQTVQIQGQQLKRSLIPLLLLPGAVRQEYRKMLFSPSIQNLQLPIRSLHFSNVRLPRQILSLQSSVPGSSYTWTATGSSVTGYRFSAGTGSQIQQTLINTGYQH